MARPSRTLNGMITHEALKTFPSDLVWHEDGYQLFKEHWLKTALEIHDQFLLEGLVETAKKINELIERNRRF